MSNLKFDPQNIKSKTNKKASWVWLKNRPETEINNIKILLLSKALSLSLTHRNKYIKEFYCIQFSTLFYSWLFVTILFLLILFFFSLVKVIVILQLSVTLLMLPFFQIIFLFYFLTFVINLTLCFTTVIEYKFIPNLVLIIFKQSLSPSPLSFLKQK